MDEKGFENLLNSMAQDLPEPSPELVQKTIEQAKAMEIGMEFEREMREQQQREQELALASTERTPAVSAIPDKIPRKQPPPPRGVRPDRASRREQQARERALAAEIQRTEEKVKDTREPERTRMDLTELSAEAREQAARASAGGQRVKIGLEELIRQEEAAMRTGPENSAGRRKDRAKQVEAFKQRRAAEKQGMEPVTPKI